ncbi:unnamed protein product [Rodentolepis nana]|uniref:IRS-type PTB domain-containing protein n=1 Tax=Rodentolepis nana TaxID=102285 RepID=A0A0R3TXF9_RODNA|nr:unnamed protein product [Rodentolepis nana]
MDSRYGVLFKFSMDTVEGLRLVQDNCVHIKKGVRKLIKKFNIFSNTDVTRTIKLSQSGVEKQYQLRIAPNTDLIYSTADPLYKGDWNAMGFVTVHFESVTSETKTKLHENSTKEEEGSAKIDGQIEEIKNRLIKLETLVTSDSCGPIKKSTPGPAAIKKTPQAPTTAPVNPAENAAPLIATPKKSTPTVTSRPSLNKVANGTAPKTATPKVSAKPAVIKLANNISADSSVKVTPAKPVDSKKTTPTVTSRPCLNKVANNTAPKTATPKISAKPPVVKLTNNISAHSTTNVTPAKPVASKAKKNVSLENYPTPLVNSTPHVPTKSQVGGGQELSSSLKRPYNTSADSTEALSVAKKPRQEQTSDPEALAHLEEIIDAVAVGLDDPNDFAIEPPFTQHVVDEQSVVGYETDQEVIPIMDYQEFVETAPKKKKSKKHRHSKENEINGVLE